MQDLFEGVYRNDELQWDMHFQEEYLQNKSLIILKMHHSFSDGHGLMKLFSHWSNIKYQPKNEV